jgi:hypothetical protein
MHFCSRMEGQLGDGELMSETEPRVVMFLLSSNRECSVERYNTFCFRVAGRREQIKTLLSVEAAVLPNYIVHFASQKRGLNVSAKEGKIMVNNL